ncbi:MAG: hypothetical protein WA001_02190 [Patescibacteria group bacterium]
MSVLLLGVCGIVALGLSVYRLGASVNQPFLVDSSAIAEAKNIVGVTPEEQEALDKRTDTDGDGLSDWDEVNVYHTNPDLRDTCGDGQPDNVRVATGKNLNCQGAGAPEGSSPSQVYNPGTVTSTQTPAQDLQQLYPTIDTGSLFGQPAPSSTGLEELEQAAQASQTDPSTVPPAPTTDPAAQQAEIQQELPRDPVAIRAALQGKVDQATLDALSDQQLLQYYDQAVSIQTGQSTPDQVFGSPTGTPAQ